MKCFRPDGGQRPIDPYRDSCQAISRDLEYCCGDLFDLPICEVMAFPEVAGHAFLIRHGERVRRLDDIHHPVARLWMDACKFNKSHEHAGILALS